MEARNTPQVKTVYSVYNIIMYVYVHAVLATAFENCPDILKVDWEMYFRICPELGIFILTFDSFFRILSGVRICDVGACVQVHVPSGEDTSERRHHSPLPPHLSLLTLPPHHLHASPTHKHQHKHTHKRFLYKRLW